MTKRKRSDVALFGLAALIIAADQWTKYWVRQTIPLYRSAMPIEWLEPYVRFTHIQNPGAAFGLGQDFGNLLIVTALFAVLLIVLYFRRLAVDSLLLRLALGLQLGGAVGNLIDRLTIGAVIDFVDLGWFPVFNVADSAITIGSVLLAYYAIFLDRPIFEPDEAESQDEHNAQCESIETSG